jgi:hypothetical protein
MLSAAFLCCAAAAQDSSAQRMNRLAPPPSLECDRSLLTSWTGVVTEYQRRLGETRISIHTDYGTDESATLKHEGSEDPSGSFLIFGRPFQPGDWRRIEAAPGVIIKGVRATAWVCEIANARIVIDWRPGEPAIDSP